MYKVIKTRRSILQIRNFIKSYLQVFKVLFTDTGIKDEKLIINNYKNSSQIFKKQILLDLENTLKYPIIPKRISDTGELSVIISVGNFRLFVDYTEDEKEKIRYIENIEFYKK